MDTTLPNFWISVAALVIAIPSFLCLILTSLRRHHLKVYDPHKESDHGYITWRVLVRNDSISWWRRKLFGSLARRCRIELSFYNGVGELVQSGVGDWIDQPLGTELDIEQGTRDYAIPVATKASGAKESYVGDAPPANSPKLDEGTYYVEVAVKPTNGDAGMGAFLLENRGVDLNEFTLRETSSRYQSKRGIQTASGVARSSTGERGPRDWGESLFRLLAPSLTVLVGFATLTYIISYFAGKAEPPFELAKIAAIIGGFILAGGFFSASMPDLGRELKRVGSLYLVATVSFVVFGLFLPISSQLQDKNLTYYIVLIPLIISLVIATTSFSCATAWLVRIFPKLWRNG